MSTAIDIKPGTIFKSSWGYDQTNIDFYKVVKTSAKSVWLIKVGQEILSESIYGEEVVPADGYEIGKTFVRRPQFYGEDPYVSISSYAGASVWNGKPATQTHTH